MAACSRPGATAGIIGPVVVNYMREYQIGLGLPRRRCTTRPCAILVGFLAIGLICNLMIRPLNAKWFMSPEELAHEKHLAHDRAVANEVGSGPGLAGGGQHPGGRVAPGLRWGYRWPGASGERRRAQQSSFQLSRLAVQI